MTQIYLWDYALDVYEIYDTYSGRQPEDYVVGFDNCQLSYPVIGNIVFASRADQEFPGT